MKQTIQEAVEDLKNESQATQKVLDCMTDSSLNQKVYDEGRTMGTIAWHIVTSIKEMGDRVGLNINGEGDMAKVPGSASFIAQAYKNNTESLINSLQKCKDEDMGKQYDMYGEMWTLGQALNVIVRHEIHHRGQISVLMRQAGLKFPGIYGPTKEEWSDYNMPPMP